MKPRIRNFAIIAHIDHGKSTLADRFLELTQTIPEKKMRAQYLDQLELERERGITIKMAPVRMRWSARGETTIFHCIDTPGHVDFAYEVSRALKSCEGALLLVDASQGVQAQTLAHGELARKLRLKLLLAINKVDLPKAKPKEVAQTAQRLFGIPEEATFFLSAKTGQGVKELLDALAEQIPAPEGDSEKPLRALIFDSSYDSYKGVVLSVRLFDGKVSPGDPILLFHTGKTYEVEEVGAFAPHPFSQESLLAGEVGYLTAQIKSLKETSVGDTVTRPDKKAPPLSGYAPPKPFVFAGLFPADGESFEKLEQSLQKLSLEDSSLQFERVASPSLGFGFQCGFLGPLHIEIVQLRLEREHGLDLVVTAASVPYQVQLKSGETVEVRRAQDLPEPNSLAAIAEPILQLTIVTPQDFVGKILQLLESARGVYLSMDYASETECVLRYELPLAELVGGFYEQLKVVSSGYATLDYALLEYRESSLTKLDILVGGEKIGELSEIVPQTKTYEIARRVVKRLKEEIPRHLFEVAVQAAIGSRVIARETIPALRKNVLAKCYGGDVTRKRKLLEKQKKGKKRLKQVGRVQIPQEAFLAILKEKK